MHFEVKSWYIDIFNKIEQENLLSILQRLENLQNRILASLIGLIFLKITVMRQSTNSCSAGKNTSEMTIYIRTAKRRSNFVPQFNLVEYKVCDNIKYIISYKSIYKK